MTKSLITTWHPPPNLPSCAAWRKGRWCGNCRNFKALEFLLSFGSLPTGQLAQLTGLSHGGIATLISRLENAGLVTRDRHPEDRRIVAICADHEQCAGLSFPMNQMEEAIAGIAERYSSRELSIVSSFLEDCAKLLHTFNMQQLETASQATAASS